MHSNIPGIIAGEAIIAFGNNGSGLVIANNEQLDAAVNAKTFVTNVTEVHSGKPDKVFENRRNLVDVEFDSVCVCIKLMGLCSRLNWSLDALKVTVNYVDIIVILEEIIWNWFDLKLWRKERTKRKGTIYLHIRYLWSFNSWIFDSICTSLQIYL